MRLPIEPSTATRTSHSTPDASLESTCRARMLPVTMQPQRLANWCWAAIAASLRDFYGGPPLLQPAVATLLLGYDCSRYAEDPAVAARCDQCAMLDAALKLAGCYSHWSPGKPTFERIQSEIHVGRPVCFCVEWQGGGTHYAVITGYDSDRREIYVQDPLHGPSVQPYDPFPWRYRGSGGTWRTTVWTRSPNPDDKEMRA